MGRWGGSFLIKQGYHVILSGRNQERLKHAAEDIGAEAAADNTQAVKQARVVILSVPIERLEDVAKEIAPHVTPEHVILDISSNKVLTLEILHQNIEEGLVLGIHPMFGPGAMDIAGQSFVLTPITDGEKSLAKRIKDYLEKKRARVTIMDPVEHDDIMSVVLGLAHFIGIVSADTLLGTDKLEKMRAVGGSTFRLLLTLAEGVVSEDTELYTALQMSLPQTASIEQEFQERARLWAKLVEDRDGEGFLSKMNALKGKLRRLNPDFDKSYQDMYKLMDER